MTQTVGRIMPRDPRRGEILIHQHVDLGPEEMHAMPFRTWKEIQTWRVVSPPDLEGLLHIGGEIHDAIHLPFAPVDADGARVQINRVPGQGTHFRDPEPTASHA